MACTGRIPNTLHSLGPARRSKSVNHQRSLDRDVAAAIPTIKRERIVGQCSNQWPLLTNVLQSLRIFLPILHIQGLPRQATSIDLKPGRDGRF